MIDTLKKGEKCTTYSVGSAFGETLQKVTVVFVHMYESIFKSGTALLMRPYEVE